MNNIRENIALAPFTTLGVGGAARWFIDSASVKDVIGALGEAKRRGIGVAVLGGGSNTLVPDIGIDGLVLHISIPGIELVSENNEVLLITGGGVAWDAVVTYASEHALWGIENLAAIPGTIGAAPVQNIGAYGRELSNVFEWADVVERNSGDTKRITKYDAAFGYRDSIFKKNNAWVITKVALCLSRTGVPDISYKDLADISAVGGVLSTPAQVANAVRTVRTNKMPPAGLGSAGSFFKNPIITHKDYAALQKRIPGIIGFECAGNIKVPLAWILDHVLNLRGVSFGTVQLYEKHLLVLITKSNATETDINKCAREISTQVYEATGITIEREVQTLKVC